MSLKSPCLSPRHLRDDVIIPVLRICAGDDAPGFASAAGVELVLGTAAVESRLRALRQIGGGPALGLWQMEPATHEDIWANFLRYRAKLGERILMLRGECPPKERQLVTNLAYGAAMCRAHYYRRPEPLPAAGDVLAQGFYWKAHYNTHLGAGKPGDYVDVWRTLVAPFLT
ncbi:hypothetical protein [Azospirillum halopraeferens]|uniref:hypothetical protein n=1 Tax=Azospirillum halopraeferens TaxID=34010 RepID=UPI000401DCBA|nr:hypothetical protein [Azospirillum halopraeferens]